MFSTAHNATLYLSFLLSLSQHPIIIISIIIIISWAQKQNINTTSSFNIAFIEVIILIKDEGGWTAVKSVSYSWVVVSHSEAEQGERCVEEAGPIWSMPFHYCTACCSSHSSATGKECRAGSVVTLTLIPDDKVQPEEDGSPACEQKKKKKKKKSLNHQSFSLFLLFAVFSVANRFILWLQFYENVEFKHSVFNT